MANELKYNNSRDFKIYKSTKYITRSGKSYTEFKDGCVGEGHSKDNMHTYVLIANDIFMRYNIFSESVVI